MQVHADIPENTIRDLLNEFVGEIYQKPPVRASVKRETRKRFIYQLDVYEIDGRKALFKCSCQAGTYMRKLCSDIGEVLGCGAHMRELRRTRAGPFMEDDSLVTLHQLSAAQTDFESGDDSALRKIIQPMEVALSSLPKVVIRRLRSRLCLPWCQPSVTRPSAIGFGHRAEQTSCPIHFEGRGSGLGPSATNV